MLLDELVAAIDNVKSRIELHQSSLRQSEALTRYSLIDPMLRALGWDTEDPALVVPEYRAAGGFADYALMGLARPVSLLEAKKLGENLTSGVGQALNYCNEQGINFMLVSDGDTWVMYEVFRQAPIEERRMVSLSVRADPVHETALKLLLLWRPNLASGEPVAAKETVLSAELVAQDSEAQANAAPPTSKPEPARLLSDAQAVTVVPPSEEPSIPPNDWIPLSDFSPQTGDKVPSEIRFSDGYKNTMDSRGWWRLVEKTAIWLWSRGLLTNNDVPVPSGNKRYIVNIEQKHLERAFNSPKSIADTGLFTEGNVDCKAATTNAKKLLTSCGEDPSKVHLKLN